MVFDPLVILLCNRENRSMLVAVWEREGSIRTNKFSGSKAICNKRHISLAGTRNAVVVKEQTPSAVIKLYCGRSLIETALYIFHALIETFHPHIRAGRMVGAEQNNFRRIAFALYEKIINPILFIDRRINHAAVLFFVQNLRS